MVASARVTTVVAKNIVSPLFLLENSQPLPLTDLCLLFALKQQKSRVHGYGHNFKY